MRNDIPARKDFTMLRKRISLVDTKDERNKVAYVYIMIPCLAMLFFSLVFIALIEKKTYRYVIFVF
jgi:hypothetical protein